MPRRADGSADTADGGERSKHRPSIVVALVWLLSAVVAIGGVGLLLWWLPGQLAIGVGLILVGLLIAAADPDRRPRRRRRRDP